MPPEPRSTPAPAPEPAAGNGAGRANGSGANGSPTGNGSTTSTTQSVLVASGAESALAAVERHLRQEAIEARLVATSQPTAATTTIARPAPSGTRVRVAPLPDDGWDDADAEFWGETRPRRRRPAVDLDTLPADERRAVGRLQARKVRRILRHVSPWSVFKFSLLFYLCVWLIGLVAGVILWRVGQEAGAISNIETFYAKATGEVTFELDGRAVFRAAASAGVVLVAAGTVFTVILAVLFNLITDLTGGVRLTVVELGDARRPVNTRRSGGRSLLRRTRSGSKRSASGTALPSADETSSSRRVPA